MSPGSSKLVASSSIVEGSNSHVVKVNVVAILLCCLFNEPVAFDNAVFANSYAIVTSWWLRLLNIAASTGTAIFRSDENIGVVVSTNFYIILVVAASVALRIKDVSASNHIDVEAFSSLSCVVLGLVWLS